MAPRASSGFGETRQSSPSRPKIRRECSPASSPAGPRHELFAYVEDVDATVAGLRDAGASVLRAPADMPWGERVGFVADPEGNVVSLAAPASPLA